MRLSRFSFFTNSCHGSRSSLVVARASPEVLLVTCYVCLFSFFDDYDDDDDCIYAHHPSSIIHHFSTQKGDGRHGCRPRSMVFVDCGFGRILSLVVGRRRRRGSALRRRYDDSPRGFEIRISNLK